jgi:hypothetical protein
MPLPEHAGGPIPMQREANVLHDFLWTTPPLGSRCLEFRAAPGGGQRAEVEFAGERLTFTLDPAGVMSLARGGAAAQATVRRSESDRYYDLDRLGTKAVVRSRMVSRTRMVTRQELVTKTRHVMKSVPVQRSRSVPYYDSYSKSTRYRAEYYTEYQMQSVPESYTAMEPRTYWEPYTTWETVHEQMVDIPAYDYYQFEAGGGARLLVYKAVQPSERCAYYLQNPTYFAANYSAKALAKDGEVRIIAIDADADGRYFEEEDRLLFNSWNPYKRDSRFQEVPGFLDNYWYRLGELRHEKLVDVTAAPDLRSMRFESPNDRFAGVKGRGHIRVSGIPRKTASLHINGTRRKQGSDGVFEGAIEYGVYRVRIESPGHLDHVALVTIDEASPRFELAYSPGPAASVLRIDHVSLRHWKVAVSDGTRLVGVYNDATKVSLAPGEYKVTVASGGYNLTRKVLLAPGRDVAINYDAEVKAEVGPEASTPMVEDGPSVDAKAK